MTDEDTGTQVIEWNVNDKAIAEIAEACKDVDAYKDLDAAKLAKKGLTKMRTKLGEAHKETKAEALAFGRKVDAEKNRLLVLIRAIEDPISVQLTEIKEKAEREEAEREQLLMNEIERIQAYSMDRHSLTLDELNERLKNLREQEPSSEIVLSIDMCGSKWVDDWDLSKEEADLKLRLAIDREETRIKEEAAKAAVEEENRVLREKLAKQEAQDAERERKLDEQEKARNRKAREEHLERQAELDAQQAAIDAEKKRIRDENEALAEAGNKARAAEEAAKLAALQAPDKVKLTVFAGSLKDTIDSKPVMGSTAGNTILLDAIANLIATHDDLINLTEEL